MSSDATKNSSPDAASPDEHGRGANKPSQIPLHGWKEIGQRVVKNIGDHNISLVAAGVALFALLAVFPALNVTVSLYALFASPGDILTHLESLRALLPEQALEIFTDQFTQLAMEENRTIGVTLALSVIIGFWVARKGAKAMIVACNIVYGEPERRPFWKLMLVSIAFTVIGIVGFVILALLAILLPIALSIIPMGSELESLLRFLRWPILAILFVLGLQCIYRFAPNRRNPKWRWVSWGAIIAAALWLAASLGFTLYVQNFADYNETYGAIGGVIVLILWFYISAFVILLGAEINAEMEHQTEVDSTIGEDKPMGERGAYVADTAGVDPDADKQ